MGRLNSPVYILGVGCTKFGKLTETPEIQGMSILELAAEAAKEALADAHTDPSEIDAYIIGNHMPQSTNMGSLYSQLAKWIGMQYKDGVQMAAACSTTNVGATLAAAQIASGHHRKVLVIGVEATQDTPRGLSPYDREVIPSDNMWLWTDMGVGQAYSVPQGYDIFPVYNGFLGLGYCRKYGLRRRVSPWASVTSPASAVCRAWTSAARGASLSRKPLAPASRASSAYSSLS
jgi:acetyl-CoA C-acetyltransferase